MFFLKLIAVGFSITLPFFDGQVCGQEFLGEDVIPTLGSFLFPCEALTIHTQCTEEEYESNDDCLPQKKDNCDRSKDLFCHAGVCLPNCHPTKETYDPIEEKCVRKVDSECRSNSTTSSFNSSAEVDPNGNSQITSTPVVPSCERHAVCDRGFCKCAQNYSYDPVFGKCMRSASYATYCNSSIACDRKSDIFCSENQCQCKSPSQYYHLKRKRCYIQLGQVCSTGLQFCPDNSNCLQHDFQTQSNRTFANTGDAINDLNRLFEEHQSGRYTSNGDESEEHFIGIWGGDEEGKEYVCKCDKGYSFTQDKRFCHGLHKTRCNTLHRCNLERGLKCIDSVCLCGREKGNEQVFSEQFQTCITRIGASCNENQDDDGIEKDICPIGGMCTQGKCVCAEGLTPLSLQASLHPNSVAYSCVKSYGMECNISGNSSGILSPTDPFEPLCNHEIGLECNPTERKCMCRDNQFYDTQTRLCQEFQVDSKIPIVHFTPPDDREYNFKRRTENGGSSAIMFLQDLYPILNLSLTMVPIFIYRIVISFTL